MLGLAIKLPLWHWATRTQPLTILPDAYWAFVAFRLGVLVTVTRADMPACRIKSCWQVGCEALCCAKRRRRCSLLDESGTVEHMNYMGVRLELEARQRTLGLLDLGDHPELDKELDHHVADAVTDSRKGHVGPKLVERGRRRPDSIRVAGVLFSNNPGESTKILARLLVAESPTCQTASVERRGKLRGCAGENSLGANVLPAQVVRYKVRTTPRLPSGLALVELRRKQEGQRVFAEEGFCLQGYRFIDGSVCRGRELEIPVACPIVKESGVARTVAVGPADDKGILFRMVRAMSLSRSIESSSVAVWAELPGAWTPNVVQPERHPSQFRLRGPGRRCIVTPLERPSNRCPLAACASSRQLRLRVAVGSMTNAVSRARRAAHTAPSPSGGGTWAGPSHSDVIESKSHMRDPDLVERTIVAISRRLRAVEHAASDVVAAVEALRAAVRQAEEAIQETCCQDVARRPAVPAPLPASPPVALNSPRLTRAKEVASLCGLCRTTIWRLRRSGEFPPCYRISVHAVAWRAEEVDAWIESRRSTKG